MDLSIRRFGRHARDMVGVLQAARGESRPRARYLLCRPFGQEAVRTAAVYRVLADRLAREGCESLRFDYHGTGDSPGEESQQSLSDWVEDTLAAHEQLDAGQGVQVHWFGMALGATLALRAAHRARVPPSHLVLWEPVLDGMVYVNALLGAHRAELVREFGHPWKRLIETSRATEPTLPGDVLGFEIGPTLAAELRQLRDISVAPALRRGIPVVCAVHAEQRAAVASMEGHSLFRVHAVESRVDWMASQAMGTAIVPPDLPQTLLSTLT